MCSLRLASCQFGGWLSSLATLSRDRKSNKLPWFHFSTYKLIFISQIIRLSPPSLIYFFKVGSSSSSYWSSECSKQADKLSIGTEPYLIIDRLLTQTGAFTGGIRSFYVFVLFCFVKFIHCGNSFAKGVLKITLSPLTNCVWFSVMLEGALLCHKSLPAMIS